MMTVNYLNRRSLRNWLPDFRIHPIEQYLFVLLLLWFVIPYLIYPLDPTAALPDVGIWSLILLSIIVFLMLLLLSTYLFKRMIKWLGLPAFDRLVSQFKTLTLWEQYVFYWASFALLLLAAIGCLIAIC
ncbi:hypothetical protein [Pedobacter arcticus]|uniref:hypothetical protein n=1 Tax=Pedobacter arcticus TaxID=752140 RepID=UPI0013756320|nr:hypothetical protein [Pedobacter arcticus]